MVLHTILTLNLSLRSLSLFSLSSYIYYILTTVINLDKVTEYMAVWTYIIQMKLNTSLLKTFW